MEPYKVIMIGIGHAHADGVMEELKKWCNSQDKNEKLFDIVGYYEPDSKILAAKKNTATFSDITCLSKEDLDKQKGNADALLIETTMPELLDYANTYLEWNVPMHIDKPMTQVYKDFADFMDNAKEKSIPIQMGYMYRYNAAFNKSLQMINSGNIGTIYEVTAVMNTELSEEQRKGLSAYIGGTMYVYGCHLIDLLAKLQGECDNVTCFLRKTGFEGADDCDCTMAIFDYGNGTSIIRSTGVEANGYGRRQLVICGSKGTIVIEPMENPMKMTYAVRDGQNVYSDKAKAIELDTNKGRYEDMLKDFARLIKKYQDEREIKEAVVSDNTNDNINENSISDDIKENNSLSSVFDEDIIFPVDYEYEKTVHKMLLKACGIAVD